MDSLAIGSLRAPLAARFESIVYCSSSALS